MDIIKILKRHSLWLNGKPGGRRADFSDANLRGADLRGVNLSGADFMGANLSAARLVGANFTQANLPRANLSGANISYVTFSRACLRRANLAGVKASFTNFTGADLTEANLSGAKLEFSSGIPLNCGKGEDIIICDRLFSQMVYYLTRQNTSKLSPRCRDFLEGIPEDIADMFLNYRDDLRPIKMHIYK
jgi:hypothetical protein